jgi:hypothetical protein
MSERLLDRAGRRRSPATLPGFHAGHAPGNKGLRYPADPPKIEEIIAVMRAAGDGTHGRRLRGVIVVMWRAGLRIQRLSLSARAISISAAAHCSFGAGKAGAVARSAWTLGGWEQLQPWIDARRELRSVRCSASSTARRADAAGRPRPAPSSGAPRPRQGCGAVSRHTSSVTPTRSRWPAKPYR